MTARVQSFHHRDTGTWSHVVDGGDGNAAAIIDPVLDFDIKSGRTGTVSAQALLDHVAARRLDVQWILETHAHADHLSAAQWLKSRLPGATLAIGSGIRAVQAHFRDLYNLDDFPVDGSQFDRLFDDGDTFELGTLQVRAIAAPGHTSDSTAYLVGDALFPGDTLFMADSGTARCDFPGGDAATLYRSIRRLFQLPGETRVFACHDYGKDGREIACQSSIAEQRRDNIHVHDGIDEAAYVAMRNARDATLAVPALLLPALQVNIRAGALPEPEANGIRYLKLPLDAL
ncbi:MAG: MBL fold metallo-hydrolase [Pseudomonadota bacterium]|nr:MBL fold metallo-hydrolase [Pseudomonadota bacterium]